MADHAWLLPSVLLVGEVLALQARFSTAPFEAIDARWATLLLGLREFPRVLLSALTAVVILGWRGIAEEFSRLRSAAVEQSERSAWVILQLGSFALLWGSAALLLERDPDGGPPETWLLLGWPLLAVCTAGLAARATAPLGAWSALLRRRWRLILTAASVGTLAWVAGTWSQAQLREILRLPTLRVAYAMLDPFVDGAFIAPEAFQFGTQNFRVDLAPGCSGLDGIGLVGTFTAAWLFWMRKELRFPRALVLLPVGIAASWLFNAMRLAMLAVIGEHGSGEAAIAGFHSVAGLVLFCITAIGVVTIGHSARFQAVRGVERAPWFDATSAYLLPLLAWIGLGLLAEAFPITPGVRLVVRGAAVIALLAAGRRHLGELARWPTKAGLIVTAACGALSLFLPRAWREGVMASMEFHGALEQVLGAVGTLALTPLVEELAFRGYLMRRPASVHFELVDPRRAGWIGILLSTLLFGLLHPAWHVGLIYGFLFCVAYAWRGRLTDAILAHAVSNLTLLLIA
jgi:exosortase E/protease (VPEID-CTERM system)